MHQISEIKFRQIIVMVFSKKSFLYSIVAFIAFLPLFAIANSAETASENKETVAKESQDPTAEMRAQIAKNCVHLKRGGFLLRQFELSFQPLDLDFL